jgi:hypothetical protein
MKSISKMTPIVTIAKNMKDMLNPMASIITLFSPLSHGFKIISKKTSESYECARDKAHNLR